MLYHFNKNNNVQAKLSASQYKFCANVSTKTVLHDFVLRVKHCLIKKKSVLDIFLDIARAFDIITFHGDCYGSARSGDV